MQFLKKYWYLVVVFIITVALGVVTFLISQKLKQEAPVAPTVPQQQPKAVTQACTLAFALATPTPTPTETPTETPTNTPTPTPTPTSAANTSPECTGLSASPNSASSAPLTVNFTCSGIDPDGDITGAEFSFGDGKTQLVEKNVGSPGTISISYNYAQNGNFSASCRVRDNNFKFSTIPDSCKKNITIGSGQTTTTTTTTVVTNLTPTPTSPQLAQASPTAAPTPKVPVSGAPSILGAFIIAGGILVLTLGLAL